MDIAGIESIFLLERLVDVTRKRNFVGRTFEHKDFGCPRQAAHFVI